MGLPAVRVEVDQMDEQASIAVLEASVDHIQQDVSEIKGDLRGLRTELKELDLRLSGKIDALKDAVATAKIWALVLYVALAASLLGAMWQGFSWLAQDQKENFTRLEGRLEKTQEQNSNHSPKGDWHKSLVQ